MTHVNRGRGWRTRSRANRTTEQPIRPDAAVEGDEFGGDALPQVPLDASLKAALFEITQKGLGMTAVVDDAGKVAGLFTDGDLRRALEHAIDLQQAKIADLMTRNPKTIRADELAVAAVEKMDTLKINGLLVVDADRILVGALNMHDLLKAGVV